jgi:membrane protein
MGRLITLGKRSLQSFGSDRCATLSAAIAYYTVFALFPMALVGVSVLGFFIGDVSARRQVVDGIASVITLGDEGKEALSGTLRGASSAKGWLGLIGLATAAWSASGLFGAIRTALDSVWDVDRPLPLLRAKARDLMLFFGFGGLLFASTASTGALQGARQAGADWLGPLLDLAAPLFALLAFVAPLLLTFAAFLVLYRFAPHARLGLRDVWPAAVMAALFVEFGKNILSYYIRNLGNFNALAGSLGAAILFLAFVYYAAQVILFAAEFAKHRMLVNEGTLPATDPRPAAVETSLGKKVKGSLVRLWRIEEQHHDAELPYAPGRLDPATNRPTNTREGVLFNQQQAQERAGRDAGGTGAGSTGGPRPAYTSPGANRPVWPGTLASRDEPGTHPAGERGAVWWRIGGFLLLLALSLVRALRRRRAQQKVPRLVQ